MTGNALPRVKRAAHAHEMPYGTKIDAGGARFNFWAPLCDRVDLSIRGRSAPVPMARIGGGWFEAHVADAGPGAQYRFILPGGATCADPASRYQPDGPHGFSEVVDPRAYEWRHAGDGGKPWHEAVLYELHIGAFTTEGTFRAAIDKLDHLAALGVTAIEVMPLADFPGGFDWGYDGVLLFAPARAYGRPDDFKAFVDAAHERGLMVLLDVVYNHFGPDGNDLGRYAPITTRHHKTPWGDAVNFDDDNSGAVRAFIIHNALYWLEEFRLDGLRLDSISHIKDSSGRHLLVELAERVRAATPGRDTHLIVENPRNHAGWMKRGESGAPLYFTAQWSDDIHNTLHCFATGETRGYYADYGRDLDKLGRALAEGFCYQGDVVPSSGRANGEPSAYLPPAAFISYVQNHDQIGNRPFGERIAALAKPEAVRAISAIHLLSPHTPLLFMGEEWGSARPFHYFADVKEELADSIREGRAGEFSEWFEHASATDAELPDPTARETFLTSKLDWSEKDAGEHADWMRMYARLLSIRHAEIAPRNAATGGFSGSYEIFPSGALRVQWRLGDGSLLELLANLDDRARPGVECPGRELWSVNIDAEGGLGPWAVRWSVEEPAA